MLEPHLLVLDIIFDAKSEIDSDSFVAAFGGEDLLKTYTIFDPDTQDPRLEMELSPSYPFRRQRERRLMIIDNDFGALKQKEDQLVVTKDLRDKKKQLLDLFKNLPLRFARLFSLGTWGDAVWISKDAADFRAISLLGWALDPNTDEDGKTRETPLNQREFEAKLQAYPKRIEELDEETILQNIGSATLTKDEDHIVIDVLDEKGHWNLEDSARLEESMAALTSFSMIPGAPQVQANRDEPKTPQTESVPTSDEDSDKKNDLDPITFKIIEGQMLLLIPDSVFDLAFAAKIGKKDWETVLGHVPTLSGAQKDLVYKQGLDFLTPIEFFSEVMLDGTPLTKKAFQDMAVETKAGVKTMQVRFPRFGEVQLLQTPDQKKWITSDLSDLSTKSDAWNTLLA